MPVTKKRPPPKTASCPLASASTASHPRPPSKVAPGPPICPAPVHQYPRFRTAPLDSRTHYSALAAINDLSSSLHFTSRLELRGSWIITPQDLASYNWLKAHVEGLSKTDIQSKETWAVVRRVPVAIHPEELLKLRNVKSA